MNLRPLKVVRNYVRHAEGSCLFSMGKTTVLCAATIENRVPPFIEHQGLSHGWVTAEYSMLPRAGRERTPRNRGAGSGRSQEISRLIGRSLRGITDLEALGPRTVIIDCDVLCADGGTRTASINGAFIALVLALRTMVSKRMLSRVPVKQYLGAVSVGIVDGKPALDLDAERDNRAEVDMNVVMVGSGAFVEIQGTAEKSCFSRQQLDALLTLAGRGIREVIAFQRHLLGDL